MAHQLQAGTELFDGRVRLIGLHAYEDQRGLLTPFDFSNLPFVPSKVFAVSHVPEGETRGRHAHQYGEQLLWCLQGRIGILIRHDGNEATLMLEPSGFGLLIGQDVWCQQTYLVKGSVLLVFASHPYDPQSYVTG
jgi:dTDP-4-dehydrorhamnose 3,5-epimerase-like enzyme